MESEYTSYNFSLFAIFLPKIIKIDGNLTKFRQKQFCTVFLRHGGYAMLAPCAGGQSYCVGLWTGHRYKKPALQAAHAVWSLGATVSPFIIGHFLVELPVPPKDSARNVSWTSESSVLEAASVTHSAVMSNYSRFAGTLQCDLR